MIDDKIPYCDPTTGEVKLISSWAYHILCAEEKLDTKILQSITRKGKPLSDSQRKTLSDSMMGKTRAKFSSQFKKNLTRGQLKRDPKSRVRKTPQMNSKSGYTGIYWYKSTKRWLVQISINGTVHSVGYFESLDDAIAARIEAEKRRGY